MNRHTSKSTMGGGQVKCTVRMTTAPCEWPSLAARQEQIQVLKNIANTPELHFCGMAAFQKLTMWHDGISWVVELEAVGTE